MDLTLGAAFSADSLLGHMSYVLLLISMLMRRMMWLRIFAIGSALAGISYDLFILHNPVGIFWETSLLIANVVQLAVLKWADISARFSQREQGFLQSRLSALGRGKAKKLMSSGQWEVLPAGTVLLEEGKPVDRLIYLQRGLVDISSNGYVITQCVAQDFIGEMGVLSRLPASASAVTQSECCIWSISAEKLLAITAKDQDIALIMDAAFSQNYREKIMRNNAALQGLVSATQI